MSTKANLVTVEFQSVNITKKAVIMQQLVLDTKIELNHVAITHYIAFTL